MFHSGLRGLYQCARFKAVDIQLQLRAGFLPLRPHAGQCRILPGQTQRHIARLQQLLAALAGAICRRKSKPPIAASSGIGGTLMANTIACLMRKNIMLARRTPKWPSFPCWVAHPSLSAHKGDRRILSATKEREAHHTDNVLHFLLLQVKLLKLRQHLQRALSRRTRGS